ncbi:hypothetical protein KIPB_008755, partial [Kipferlia bialata]
EAFSDRNVVGLPLRSLSGKNEQAAAVIAWMEDGMFDALQRGYLRGVVFGIFLDPDDESKLIESYSFKVSHGPDGDTLGVSLGGESAKVPVPSTRDGVKNATVQLMRRLIAITGTLPPLPDPKCLVLKLFYTKDTPCDYEPRHFVASDDHSALCICSDTHPVTAQIGNVNTAHHSFSLKLTAPTHAESTAAKPAPDTATETETESHTESGRERLSGKGASQSSARGSLSQRGKERERERERERPKRRARMGVPQTEPEPEPETETETAVPERPSSPSVSASPIPPSEGEAEGEREGEGGVDEYDPDYMQEEEDDVYSPVKTRSTRGTRGTKGTKGARRPMHMTPSTPAPIGVAKRRRRRRV